MQMNQTDNTHNIKLAYSIAEAVQATGISRSTLYTHIKEGRLRTTHIGARTVILAEHLMAWLTSFSNVEVA